MSEPLTSAELDRMLEIVDIERCNVECAIYCRDVPRLIARIRELEGHVRELARDRAYLHERARALLKEKPDAN